MPLVIINQRDVKAVITFHMVRKTLKADILSFIALTWCPSLLPPVGKEGVNGKGLKPRRSMNRAV